MAGNSIIAFDFGTKSIGVAIGQCVTYTARLLTTFKACDGVPDWLLVEKLLNKWQPETIVVGLPLNMDGSEQPFTSRARKFANQLHGRFGIRVVLHDERLSTVEAIARLFERGGYRALNKSQIDAESAVIILESWFQQFLDNHYR